MITATAAQKIDQAVELVIADGECAVPQYNDFGGVDLWLEGQVGYREYKRGGAYLAEGVRVAIDDNEIIVIKFGQNGGALGKVTCTDYTSVELLAQIVKGLL